MTTRRGWWLIALAAACCGCGDDDSNGRDGAIDAGTSDAAAPDADESDLDGQIDGFIPTVPDRPAPPRFTPCPTGWHQVVADNITTCDPYPSGGASTCPAGQAHFPGEPGCSAAGTPCGADDWATDLPAGANILYVKRGASPSGAGTRVAPYTNLTSTLALATPGTIIAIDKQSYTSMGFAPPAGVTLWGACAGATMLTSPADLDQAVITPQPGTLAIRNLTISGDRYGLTIPATTTVTVRGVEIVGSRRSAIDVHGRLDAAGLIVRGVRSVPPPSTMRGRAVYVRPTAEATIVRAVFEDNQSSDLVVDAGRLTASDLAVRGTIAEPGGCPTCDDGLNVSSGGSAVVARAMFLSQPDVSVRGNDATLRLTDVVMRDGLGMYDVDLQLDRGLIEGGGHVGCTESTGRIEDLVVRDATEHGLSWYVCGGLPVTRAAVLRSRGHCVYLPEFGLTLTDVSLSGCDGHGIEIGQGSLSAYRLEILDAHTAGVAIGRSGTITATDLRIERTRPPACSLVSTGCPMLIGYGAGLSTRTLGAATLRRFHIADNTLIGVQIGTRGELDLSQGVIADQPVGVNLQRTGYDLSRLHDQVLYLRNDVNLDTSTLPLPPVTLLP